MEINPATLDSLEEHLNCGPSLHMAEKDKYNFLFTYIVKHFSINKSLLVLLTILSYFAGQDEEAECLPFIINDSQ